MYSIRDVVAFILAKCSRALMLTADRLIERKALSGRYAHALFEGSSAYGPALVKIASGPTTTATI